MSIASASQHKCSLIGRKRCSGDSRRQLRQVRDKNFAISSIATNVYFERTMGQSVKKGRDGGGGQFPGN